MLELRNVTKIYRSKTGAEVKALDRVNVTFPESGMVFILGKSGSGKSTLLNVIGGLDGADGGEFIIKGKSSKDFGGSDFDAYRNTFIGFIFQEYNILDDFTVGANIALALELQGKKATGERISEILAQVDLLDYAKRRPNELSGGQKQRIAIARALVKNPEIIMADEPTGALDSKTGKQIFDTLKELSKTKLVIIVSHDRDFAERYGDRIIEMKDGKIESDHTKHERVAEDLSEGVTLVNDGILKIKSGYELTEKDLSLINAYLKRQSADVFVSGDGRVNNSIRTAAGITAEGKASSFDATDAEKDIKTKAYTKADSRFIRSRLPMKNAVKIGSSGLGHKKFRLVLTIFLSMIAFALFGFADTMGAYDKYVAATESIVDSDIRNATFSLGVRHEWTYDDGGHYYYNEEMFNDADIALLEEKTGLSFLPVFNGGDLYSHNRLSITRHMKDASNISSSSVFTGYLSGFSALDENVLEKLGFNFVAGTLPKADDEIVISELVYREFAHTGFVGAQENETIEANVLTQTGASALIGKHISVDINGFSRVYTIAGVLDTMFDYNRYESFMPSAEQGKEEMNILDMVLAMELENTLRYGYHTLAFVSSGAMKTLLESAYFPSYNYVGVSTNGNYTPMVFFPDAEGNVVNSCLFHRLAGTEHLSALNNIKWLDGRTDATLKEGEVLLPWFVLENAPLSYDITDKVEAAVLERYGTEGRDFFRQNGYDLAYTINIMKQFEGWEREEQTIEAKEIFHMVFGDAFGEGFSDEYYYDIVFSRNYLSGFGNPVELSLSKVREILNQANHSFQVVYPADFIINKPVYGAEISMQKVVEVFFEISGMSMEDLSGCVSNFEFKLSSWDTGNEVEKPLSGYKLVGFFDSADNENIFVSDTFYNEYISYCRENGYGIESVYPHEQGKYSFVITPMPKDTDTIRRLVELSYDESSGLRFELQNMVMDTLASFNEFIEIGAIVFLWVGVGFAVFSALMLMNFISISISYKRREIGILRALGARSSDVFKIFFSEAAIIALINYVLAVIVTVVSIMITNNLMRGEGINVTLLNFGLRQVILMLAISLAVAAVASFLPVYNIARRKPVDAIKNK